MCTGKGNAFGAQVTAVVFCVLTALLAIGSCAGPYYTISCGGSTVAVGLQSYTYSVGSDSSTATYASISPTSTPFRCFDIALSSSLASCAVYKFAASLGAAAIALYVIGMLFFWLSTVFMVLRAQRLRKAAPTTPSGARSCHSRGCTTICLNVFGFILMLIGSILAWTSILPVALLLVPGGTISGGGLCVPATGAGSTLAGINIALSFIGFLCDACSHCCCKSVKSLGGPSTVVVITQPAHHMAMPVAQQAPAQGASLWRVNTDGKEKCECCR